MLFFKMVTRDPDVDCLVVDVACPVGVAVAFDEQWDVLAWLKRKMNAWKRLRAQMKLIVLSALDVSKDSV